MVSCEDYSYNRLSLYSVDTEPPVIAGRAGDYAQSGDMGTATLQSYDLPVSQAGPGDVAHLVVYLKVHEPFTLTTSLVGLDEAGFRTLESVGQRLDPERGTTRVRFDVPIYSHTPPGQYRFVLSSSSSDVVLDRALRIVGTPPLEKVAAIPNARDLRLGESAHLLGFDAPAHVKPGPGCRSNSTGAHWPRSRNALPFLSNSSARSINPRTRWPAVGWARQRAARRRLSDDAMVRKCPDGRYAHARYPARCAAGRIRTVGRPLHSTGHQAPAGL